MESIDGDVFSDSAKQVDGQDVGEALDFLKKKIRDQEISLGFQSRTTVWVTKLISIKGDVFPRKKKN